MQKIVSNGARTTGRFTLDGGECEVIFSSPPYLCFEVKNEGTADVIVSIESGKTAADSGVIIVAPQTSATLAHMRSDVHKVYVTGSGYIQVVGKNEIESVFKLAALGDSSGGGSAENVIDDTQMLSDKTYSSNASRLTVTGNTGGSFKVSVYDINLP